SGCLGDRRGVIAGAVVDDEHGDRALGALDDGPDPCRLVVRRHERQDTPLEPWGQGAHADGRRRRNPNQVSARLPSTMAIAPPTTACPASSAGWPSTVAGVPAGGGAPVGAGTAVTSGGRLPGAPSVSAGALGLGDSG